MKRRLLSMLLVIVMVLGMLPVGVLAASSTTNVQWAGAMNFSDANNQVTSTNSMTEANCTELKWQYPLNDTVSSYGAYYAGTQVIVGDYLYASGGNKLHKIALSTGACQAEVDVPVSANLNEVQYLCYGDEKLYFAIRESITAYNLETLTQAWSVAGSFGQYHPIQYLEYNGTGYLWCNGNVLSAADGSAVTIKQQSTGDALDISGFAWSSGAQVGQYFYVTDKKNVYAIDMETWKVADQVAYFDGSTGNTSGQVAYDSASGRLFWGSKHTSAKNLYSIKVNTSGTFEANSLKSAEAGFNTVNLPVAHNGRVYLVGQGNPFVAVFDINAETDDITLAYTVGTAYATIQTNPILSVADGTPRLYFFGFDGKLYLMEDNRDSGTLKELAQSPNPSNVQYPNSYEQFAMDSNGNIYCYNESGYLFCYGKSLCEVPVITKDLDTELKKVQIDSTDAVLQVEAAVQDGGSLSYQWQESTDGANWTAINGATAASYTLPTDEAETVYYRCVITNTKDSAVASTVSSAAQIQVKALNSAITLNMAANTKNSLTDVQAGTAVVSGDKQIVYVENFAGSMKYLALGAGNEGSFEPLKENFTVYQGVPAGTSLSPSNVSNSEQYTRRYYRSAGFTLPFVAGVELTAEDGVTKDTVYVVVDNDGLTSYAVAVSGLTSESELYAAETGIAFTEAGQTVELTPETVTIGSGEEDKGNWMWTSSNAAVATVDENGVVKCIGGGEATITFTCGQLSASCKVTASAAAHTTHTYTDGACTVCGTKEPAAVSTVITLVKDGTFVTANDGTELYKAALTVSDEDKDGALTLNDAFLAAHAAYSANGTADYATKESTYGPYITKLWGIQSSSVGYYLNGAAAGGLSETVKKNDALVVYFYQDTTNYSDIYTTLSGQTTVSADYAVTYTASGMAGSTATIPKGASVKVYNSEDQEVTAMETTVSEAGTFELTFSEAGTYTVTLGGTASYTGSVWDGSLNEGQGGYTSAEITGAPVIPSRMEVTVMPAVSKTVYVSISCKNGSFAVNKNGDEMWRFPVTAKDDPAKPDGNVNIVEVLAAAHEQYHVDGISALGGHTSGFITKLWGESNGGNCSYYFNDCYMDGSGTNTGTNNRPYQDKLLNTIVEDGDHFYIYSFQATDWSKGDLYAYFASASETAVAGTAKTLTVESAGGYGTNANKLETSLVTVKDSSGNVLTGLSTTVAADGTFSITFPAAGTYTVDVRTNGTNYVTPARCIVTVTAGSGTDENDTKAAARVEALIAAIGTVSLDKENEITAARTAYDALTETQQALVTNYAVLTEAEGALANMKQAAADRAAADAVEALIAAIGTPVTAESENAITAARTAYQGLTDTQKQLVENYAVLAAAEAVLEALNTTTVDKMYAAVAAELLRQDVTGIGSTSGAWLIFGLARATDQEPTDVQKTAFEQAVKTVLTSMNDAGQLNSNKPTDNERVALALTALGCDPADYNGRNLLSALESTDWVVEQGNNSAAYALLAIHAADYDAANETALLQSLLDNQLTGGGWNIISGDADADTTAMVLQALAPYNTSEYPKVQAAVEEALRWLEGLMNEKGQIVGPDGTSSELTAQTIVALCELDIDPTSWETSNGVNLLHGLASFYVDGTQKGFAHEEGGTYDQLSTEQGFYAMVAYKRYLNSNATSLYDMSDAFTRLPQYNITISAAKGTVTVTNESGAAVAKAVEGAVLTVAVDPDEGYVLDKLMIDGEDKASDVSNGQIAFTMPAKAVTIAAAFVLDPAEVVKSIDALTVTAADAATQKKIEQIQAAYDALTAENKEKVTNYDDFEAEVEKFEELLAAAKKDAKAQLEEYFSELKEENYTKENWKEIQELLEKALADIEKAENTDEIERILYYAKRDIENVADGDEITVTFRLIGDGQHDNGVTDHEEYVTWIPTTIYKMEPGSTMYDVFVRAISDYGLSQRGAANNYVESIKAPSVLGGYWLGEFDNGPNSGWMCTVNGDHPGTGLKTYELEDGDVIIWHYVDDYIQEERTSSSKYYYRWLEAEDISPEEYLKKQDKEGTDADFDDVDKDDWFYEDVQYVVEEGLFNGTGDDKFSPNASMNRAMLVTVLYRLEGEPKVTDSSEFDDVSANQWYTDAVIWATENEIVNGYGNGKFGPTDNITREQMATILYRYAQYKKYDVTASNSLTGYSDYTDISAYALKSLKWANAESLINGRTTTTLAPQGTATRAEVAAILHRFVENVVND